MNQPVVFISYSHEDEEEKNKLLSHLSVLQSAGLVDLWSDDRLAGGDDWEREIREAITQASAAILLITANFLTSAFILHQEVPLFLKRRKREGLIIFPVIARACAWRTINWLSKMNVMPKNGKPVWSDAGSHVDEDLAAIAEEVVGVVKKIRQIPLGPKKTQRAKIKVLIADDHVHEREGFKQLLSLVDFIEVVGEATSAQEAVQKAFNLRPDVVLLDLVWYKDRTAGIAAIRQIKAEAAQIKILAATVYDELIEAARIEGADLAVDKDSLYDKSTLAARIMDAYASQGFPKPQVELPENLSGRELEVLKLIAQGKTDSEIAQELSIAVPTVKKHVSNILGKLGTSNRGGAIAVAYERGILKRGSLEF